MKASSVFECSECGYESSGWLGKCPACSSWNTFMQVTSKKTIEKTGLEVCFGETSKININDVEMSDEDRYSTGISEMDRVLGGGLVRGSLILVGGDPGIGKSTLILQVCDSVSTNTEILYVSGEESAKQIKMRANRLNVRNPLLTVISEIDFKLIQKLITDSKPGLVIIDSIQTMFMDNLQSAPGSVNQVRETTMLLMRLAKTYGITVIIVGHVTKDGAIAGPKVLEHMVDTVLYFEGERHMSYRILRAVKNRFGSTNEIGLFEMQNTGLSEVVNPSLAMLSERMHDAPGSAVTSSMEGTRPMLIEIQALVSATGFGVPRRMATGFDYNRIILLIAVLEKKMNMQLQNYDAYVNVVGGIKLEEPACDLAIIAAIVSSLKNCAIDKSIALIGEVGLTGEIRAVNHIEKRVTEAARVGFNTCIVPYSNAKALEHVKDGLGNAEIRYVKNVQQVMDILF